MTMNDHAGLLMTNTQPIIQQKMKEITSSDFETEVLAGGKVVLDFYSTECPPCEAVAPKF